jgi:hypothetical protein
MNITRPFDNEIIVVHDFGSSEDNKIIYDALASADDEPWFRGNHVSPTCYHGKAAPSNFFNSEEVPLIVESINQKAISFVNDLTDNRLECTQFGIITRNFKDGYFLHWDQENDPSIELGIVYYVNDNYQGGELFYPKLNIEYKPKAGDLIIHPGSFKYMHGVRDVTEGTRYSMNMFAKVK